MTSQAKFMQNEICLRPKICEMCWVIMDYLKNTKSAFVDKLTCEHFLQLKAKIQFLAIANREEKTQSITKKMSSLRSAIEDDSYSTGVRITTDHNKGEIARR